MGNERRSRDQPPPLTVLVVDDSATVRAVLRRMLQDQNLRVIEARNGKEAVSYAMIEQPDLVLLDIDMPVMDGLAALDALQADEDLRSRPVLMLTAHTAGKEVAQALDRGAQDYLRKPFEAAELAARVRTALKLQHREQALRRRAEELGEISTHDPLTGLGNRRLMAQWLADQPDGMPMAAFLIDVDRFKQVNDREGHLVGDRVLVQIGSRIAALVAPRQLLVRWGGEEFLVLVPEPDDAQVPGTAEALRTAIGERPFDLGDGGLLQVTASVGVARGESAAMSDLLRRADRALYQAKAMGRDCSVVAS